MPSLATVVDRVLEAPIVPSFTRIGHGVRRRLDDWTPLDSYSLDGRTVVLTGGTSGLGRAAATQLASCGAEVVIVGRSSDKNEAMAVRIAEESTGAGRVTSATADMAEKKAVHALADELRSRFDAIHVLVHNAGALFNDRRENSAGIEATVAAQVVGPFLLTGLLLDRLEASGMGRVLTMSSGGMYTAPLAVDSLEMPPQTYRGSVQYARAKRAQVTLNEQWAERTVGRPLRFHALHPGWADTPGVEAALPGFRSVMGPLLRDPLQGADTLVWLAADDGPPLATNGGFWLDRRRRPIHKLTSTRRSDTPDRRGRLWNWVQDAAGWSLGDV